MNQLNLTQAELIRRAAIDGDTLRSTMNGTRRPTRQTQIQIEMALDWPVGTILNLLTGEMTPEDVAVILDLTHPEVTPVPRNIVLELDVPLGTWQALDPLDQADVLATAKLAALRRVGEIRLRNQAAAK